METDILIALASNITSAEVEALTDYTDLRIRFDIPTIGPAFPNQAVLTWTELELQPPP